MFLFLLGISYSLSVAAVGETIWWRALGQLLWQRGIFSG